MAVQRYAFLASLTLTLALAGAAPAQETPDDFDAPTARPRDGLLPRVLHLMPPAFVEPLQLTAEQRDTIQKLDAQFNARRKATLVKAVLSIVGIIESLNAKDGDAEPAPALAIAHEVTGALLDMRRTRVALERKMQAALDPQQREMFLTLKEQGPRHHARATAHDRGVQRAAFFAPAEVQRKLRLTPEQQKKLTQLQREYETRVRGILTTEQQQQFEELVRPARPMAVPGRDGRDD
jgi:hypothetical protein